MDQEGGLIKRGLSENRSLFESGDGGGGGRIFILFSKGISCVT